MKWPLCSRTTDDTCQLKQTKGSVALYVASKFFTMQYNTRGHLKACLKGYLLIKRIAYGSVHEAMVRPFKCVCVHNPLYVF